MAEKKKRSNTKKGFLVAFIILAALLSGGHYIFIYNEIIYAPTNGTLSGGDIALP